MQEVPQSIKTSIWGAYHKFLGSRAIDPVSLYPRIIISLLMFVASY
jgi:hypothetical protein